MDAPDESHAGGHGRNLTPEIKRRTKRFNQSRGNPALLVPLRAVLSSRPVESFPVPALSLDPPHMPAQSRTESFPMCFRGSVCHSQGQRACWEGWDTSGRENRLESLSCAPGVKTATNGQILPEARVYGWKPHPCR